MKKNVLISGGSGFIGKHLTNVLISNSFTISILSRSAKQNTANIKYYKWDINTHFIEEEAVINADYILHLAGENIAEKPWTAKRKEEIVQSREQ